MMNNNSKLAKAFETKVLMPVEPISITKKVAPSILMRVFAEETQVEFIRLFSVDLLKAFPILTVDNLEKYYTTELWMRGKFSIHELPSEWKRAYFEAIVLSLLYLVLKGVGVAYDTKYGITYVPEVAEKPALTVDEFVTISNDLRRLMPYGLKAVVGLPTSKQGDVELMAMTSIDERVVSYYDTHPVYGFLASFLDLLDPSDYMLNAERIFYGFQKDYSRYILQFVNMEVDHEENVRRHNNSSKPKKSKSDNGKKDAGKQPKQDSNAKGEATQSKNSGGSAVDNQG